MVSVFTVYDLTFLIVFTLAVVLFLVVKRKNLQRQGILYLYRTKWGIKFIDSFSKKYEKLLRPLQYVAIACGYILMVSMIYLLINFSWLYLRSDLAVRQLKIPVLVPLIPYLPDIFHLDFLPSFNFTYWIIIIAIIAIPHEFAHGIFARLNKIKIHATGFGFLGPFLAAFVEPDEKSMNKMKKFPQLAILAAGTFANIVSFIILALLFWLFFALAFVPAGFGFNAYAISLAPISNITSIDGINVSSSSQIFPLLKNETITNATIGNATYYAQTPVLSVALANNISIIQVFDDSPAFNARLKGAITEIDGQKITSHDQLQSAILSHKPGDKVTIKTAYQASISSDVELNEYNITLGNKNGSAYLGVGVIPIQPTGLMGYFYKFVAAYVKDPFIYYASSWGSFGWFIYYLLWWSVLVCFSVALVNMIPVAIFDGGRFFYLTILGITGSEKFARRLFSLSTWIILLLVLLMMLKWFLVFF